MACASITPRRSTRKRALFLTNKSPSSTISSPDRYSSPPHSPRWIMETPPKITGSLLKSPRVYIELMTNTDKLVDFDSLRDRVPAKSKRNLQERYDSSTTDKDDSSDNSVIESSQLGDFVGTGQPRTPKKNRNKKKIVAASEGDRIEEKKSEFSIQPKSFYKEKKKEPAAAATKYFTGGLKRKRSPSSESGKVFRSISTGRSHLVPRRLSKRSRYGEINAGVWHGVRKPRPKKKSMLAKQFMKVPKIMPADRIKSLTKESAANATELMVAAPQETKSVGQPQSPKRAPSPPPDPSKKFFKTNRTLHISKKATVTFENNIRIEVRNGKLKLPPQKAKTQQQVRRHPEVTLPKADFEPMETDDVLQKSVNESVTKILGHLEADTSDGKTADADNCLTMSQESLQNSIDAGVVSPKQVTLNAPVEESAADSSEQSRQFYPLFYGNSKTVKTCDNSSTKKTYKGKKWHPIGNDQYQIDAGQKRFGATQCKDCGIVYQRGDPEDEIYHEKYHSNGPTLKYLGWKDERLVRWYENGRVIVVYPDDSKTWVKKVQDVMDVVNKDLGYVDIDYSYKYLGNSKVFLYISQKRIVGVLAAEPKDTAYKMLSTEVEGVDCCSAETYPVRCGVSHIWTAPDFRRKQVATRLLDCLRLRFMFDHILKMEEFAFSVPTVAGKALAEKYTGTPNYFVYT